MTRRSPRYLPPLALLLLGAVAPGFGGRGGQPEEGAGPWAGPRSANAEEGLTCRHWAVLLPEDAGQHRVYDGIRKGLEVAQLERVCLRDVASDGAGVPELVTWHRALSAPRPLLFAVGRRAGAALLAAGSEGPGVFVSVEFSAEGSLLAAEPVLPQRWVRVRAEVAAESVGSALRGLLGLASDARPAVAFAHEPATAERAAAVTQAQRRFAQAARLTLAPDPGTGVPAPRALLHLRLGVGETLLPFAETRLRAQRGAAALVADDPARFATGAALVLVPDHRRLGRTAAEAGRRLWRDEPLEPDRLVVRSTEIWVDVGAALEQGVDPPLAFLAAVDLLRLAGRSAPGPR